VFPTAVETCNGRDEDCDGLVDDGVTVTGYLDGYGTLASQICPGTPGYAAQGADCDDSAAGVYPTATEACNGRDEDCDGLVDDGVTVTGYVDGDGDGYGTVAAEVCPGTVGYAPVGSDCDDTAAGVYPTAVEVCDGRDQDCDGAVDDGVTVTRYVDGDRDGFGTVAVDVCPGTPGYATVADDCDDTDPLVLPGGTERCNEVDDDCDSTVDEGVRSTFFLDEDGDGYGVATTVQACTVPPGYATVDGDCDDAVATRNPGQLEVCNQVDDDCSGGVDDISGASVEVWDDDDGDGFGAPGTRQTISTVCPTGARFAANNNDCDDGDPLAYPGAPELCDGDDDDCDDLVDDGATCPGERFTFYNPASVNSNSVSILFLRDALDDDVVDTRDRADERCGALGYQLWVPTSEESAQFVASHVANLDVWMGVDINGACASDGLEYIYDAFESTCTPWTPPPSFMTNWTLVPPAPGGSRGFIWYEGPPRPRGSTTDADRVVVCMR
jgi:hypothetical protein